MPHQRMSYDFPFLNIRWEYHCLDCMKGPKRILKSIEPRTTCGQCGSKNIVGGPPGTFIHLEEVVKND